MQPGTLVGVWWGYLGIEQQFHCRNGLETQSQWKINRSTNEIMMQKPMTFQQKEHTRISWGYFMVYIYMYIWYITNLIWYDCLWKRGIDPALISLGGTMFPDKTKISWSSWRQHAAAVRWSTIHSATNCFAFCCCQKETCWASIVLQQVLFFFFRILPPLQWIWSLDLQCWQQASVWVAEATEAPFASAKRQVDGTDPVSWPHSFAGRRKVRKVNEARNWEKQKG